MWWLSVCLIAIVAYLLQYYYDTIRALFILWNTTGPPHLPLIGTAHYLINKSQAGLCMCFMYLFLEIFVVFCAKM